MSKTITEQGEQWIEACLAELDTRQHANVSATFHAIAYLVEHVSAKIAVEYGEFDTAHKADRAADILRDLGQHYDPEKASSGRSA